MNRVTRTVGAGAFALAFALGSTAATHAATNLATTASIAPRASGEAATSTQASDASTGRLGSGQTLQSNGNDTLYSAGGEQYRLTVDGGRGVEAGLVLESTNSLPRLLAGTGLTTGAATRVLAMQADGNLVLSVNNKPVWFTNTDNNPGAYALLQEDGNLVVYSAAGKALWASSTFFNAVETTPTFEGYLAANGYIRSENGRYQFLVQSDGNAVVYFGNRALWSTGTSNRHVDDFMLLTNGKAVVESGATQLWSSGASGASNAHYRMVMQNDGNLVIYQYRASENYSKARAMWQSGTGGRR